MTCGIIIQVKRDLLGLSNVLFNGFQLDGFVY